MTLQLRGMERHLLSQCNHTVLPATRHKWTHLALTPASHADTQKIIYIHARFWSKSFVKTQPVSFKLK